MVDDMIVGDLVKALRSETDEKSRTHSAIVSRVDGDGAVWVHVNGSSSETPTASSASEVKPGDLVNVEWRNNKLYILGNPSNPSAGGLRVNTIEQSATHAQNVATQVKETAVTNVRVEYAVGDDPENAPSAGWAKDTPEWEIGKYIWQRTVTTTDGAESISNVACIQGAQGEAGEDAVTLRIDSSRGVAFKNSQVSTVLSAVIYRGSLRITDIAALQEEFGSGAYLEWKWQGYDSDTWHTISSSDSRLGNDGFTLTLSPEDVDIKAVFNCNLII